MSGGEGTRGQPSTPGGAPPQEEAGSGSGRPEQEGTTIHGRAIGLGAKGRKCRCSFFRSRPVPASPFHISDRNVGEIVTSRPQLPTRRGSPDPRSPATPDPPTP
jgi:hypothetical protein